MAKKTEPTGKYEALQEGFAIIHTQEAASRLRDMFAAAALTGLLASPTNDEMSTNAPDVEQELAATDFACRAFELANAMMEARNLNPTQLRSASKNSGKGIAEYHEAHPEIR